MRQEPVERKLERYRLFWKRQPVDRPILGVTLSTYTPFEMLTPNVLPQDGRLTPEDVVIDDFLDWYGEDCQKNFSLGGDQFWVAVPFWGIPWMEAILGCPVHLSGSSIWAEPIFSSVQEFTEIDLYIRNHWLEKLLEFTSRLVDYTAGNYPVAPPLLRGHSDVLAALIGPQRFLLELYDHPDSVKEAADLISELWIGIAAQVLQRIPPFHGGYCNGNRQVWSPGVCIETQEDAAGMVSPNFYRSFFRTGTQRIVSSFEYGWIHIHSSYTHNLDEILSIDKMAAIELTVDTPPGPPPDDLIPIIQKIQQRKPVIVHGTFNLDEMKLMVNNLSPRGLCVISRVRTADEGNEMLEELLSVVHTRI